MWEGWLSNYKEKPRGTNLKPEKLIIWVGDPKGKTDLSAKESDNRIERASQKQ